MAERRTSWPWKKKSNNASKTEKLSLPTSPILISPVSSFKPHEASDFTHNVKQEEAAPAASASLVEQGGRILEEMYRREQAEENFKSLKQELSAALKELAAKDDLVRQHEKVAGEAISECEQAKKEALSYKQELEVANQQKGILEGRVAQLDSALKECTKQFKHVREEQERKIQEAISCTTKEWEKIKAEVDARQTELEHRLMESDAQNSAMAKSLQERAKKIVEANEGKAKVETDMKLLQVKLSSAEKEISSLKYELHVLSKELEIRNEEVQYIKKSSDAAHKQHLDNVKKMANLEADCQRLRNLIRKKLPGPAAIAQMRKEVDMLPGRSSAMSDNRRKPTSNNKLSASSSFQSRDSNKNREIEMLKEQMFSMEEETKLLKEALSKRNEELHSSRILCAKTANKLSIAEDHLESLQGTPRESLQGTPRESLRGTPRGGRDHLGFIKGSPGEANTNGFESTVLSGPSAASASGDDDNDNDEEEAESWASALISELAHFKKCNQTSKDIGKESTGSCISVDPSVSAEETSTDADCTPRKVTASVKGLDDKVISQMTCLGKLCAGLNSKLNSIEDHLQAFKPDNKDAEERISSMVQMAHVKLSELDNFIKGMSQDNAACYNDSGNGDKSNLSVCSQEPVSSVRFVLNKLGLLLEMLPTTCQNVEQKEAKADVQVENEAGLNSQPQFGKAKQALISSTDSFLNGKSSILEYLVHFAIVLCELCSAESSDLQDVLSKMTTGCMTDNEATILTEINASGYLSELSSIRDQVEQLTESKAELEKQVAAKEQELVENKKLVLDLEGQLTQLDTIRKQLTDHKAAKAELQEKLEKAGIETGKLQATVACLTVELVDQKKLYDSVLGKCEELELKLQGFTEQESQSTGIKVAEDDSLRLKKEMELVAAKEKLAECERTIQELDKQLMGISYPPAEQLAMNGRRIGSEGNETEPGRYSNHQRPTTHDQVPLMMYDQVEDAMDSYESPRANNGHYYYSQNYHNISSSNNNNNNNNNNCIRDLMVSNGTGQLMHVYSGSQTYKNSTGQKTSYMRCDNMNSPMELKGNPSPFPVEKHHRSHYQYHQKNGIATPAAAVMQDYDDEEGMPPLRYVHPGRAEVRTSLMESMNAVATNAQPAASSGSSTLGRLFSRTKR